MIRSLTTFSSMHCLWIRYQKNKYLTRDSEFAVCQHDIVKIYPENMPIIHFTIGVWPFIFRQGAGRNYFNFCFDLNFLNNFVNVD